MKFTTKKSSDDPPQKFMVEGKLIVLKKGSQLPARCIKCNKPTKRGIIRRLRWVPVWCYVFSIIVRFIVGKESYVVYGLCPEHFRKSIIFEVLSWFLLIAGGGCLVYSLLSSHLVIFLIAGIIFCAIALIFSTVTEPIRAVSMDNYMMKLKGCCDEFLESVEIKPSTPAE